MRGHHDRIRTYAALVLMVAGVASAVAVAGAQQATLPSSPAAAADVHDYVIGIGDSLSVRVWREPDLSADVVVLPNGKITLPLVNEVDVLGLSVQALREKVTTLMSQFHEGPVVSVVVLQISSRQVFITGMVNKPGAYPLLAPTSVIQLIATAGGLQDFADKEHITVVRANRLRPDGEPWSFEVNYDDIARRRDLQRNIIMLEPGDTVIVR